MDPIEFGEYKEGGTYCADCGSSICQCYKEEEDLENSGMLSSYRVYAHLTKKIEDIDSELSLLKVERDIYVRLRNKLSQIEEEKFNELKKEVGLKWLIIYLNQYSYLLQHK